MTDYQAIVVLGELREALHQRALANGLVISSDDPIGWERKRRSDLANEELGEKLNNFCRWFDSGAKP